ncbi:hypothetical protein GLAREA_01752 [Glarea lozoyensis ATCC 20868]|uniref:Uncharacterized protein n=1 Tax=Glarea lozoyensis (strain ATCC 20868 / MF5171) TaxID=1116229 RepID=S3CJ78_GLAL2|nr:uncharacterized protein GLAREA_01752 [Glarea lozoyensis ATCC 20868]EPE25840.1 hypothetical protein GLAREA_01752 [Glarea lozoyensis ATCC 20868]
MKPTLLLPLVFTCPTLAQSLFSSITTLANLPQDLRGTYRKLARACDTRTELGAAAVTIQYGADESSPAAVYGLDECFPFTKDNKKARLVLFCRNLDCTFGIAEDLDCQSGFLDTVLHYRLNGGQALPNPAGVVGVALNAVKCGTRQF